MSLSTSIGGGGLGGAGAFDGMAVAAHQAQAQVAQVAQPPQGQYNSFTANATGAGAGVPPNLASLAADLIDKQQQNLSKNQVKSVAHLPIIGVDVTADVPIIATFPPKTTTTTTTQDGGDITLLIPKTIGKVKSEINLKYGEISHKTLQKYLTNEKSYIELLKDTIGATKSDCITLSKPHSWLGARRLENVSSIIKEHATTTKATTKAVLIDNTPVTSTTAAAIAEEDTPNYVITNGTLEGGHSPTGNEELDRVVFKVRLSKNKKSVTLLPEEVTQIWLESIQNAVYKTQKKAPDEIKAIKKGKKNESSDDSLPSYPLAIALPSWACHDASMEAWRDACTTGAVFVQRSVAALAGLLVPTTKGSSLQQSPLEVQMLEKIKMAKIIHQKKNDGTEFSYNPFVVLIGITDDGSVEGTVIQISQQQSHLTSCRYGNFKTLCNLGHPITSVEEDAKKPLSKRVEDCVKDLFLLLDEVAPELSSPAAFCVYGSSDKSLMKTLENLRQDLETWEKVPILMSSPEVVARGAAVLGGVAHGRLYTIGPNDKGGKRPVAKLAIQVQNVAPTAVGIQVSYDNKRTWEPIRTIFDFDRRVPAGPYPIPMSAAECAAYRNAKKKNEETTDEYLLKAIPQYEGKKGIPQREEAALNFWLRFWQKPVRDGEWLKLGNPFQPLTKPKDADMDKTEEEGNVVAVEEVTLKLSTGQTGIVTAENESKYETLAQATISQRNSRIRYWALVIGAILFFGGFLFKSWYEEYVFKNDTAKLLAYYKNVLPGSIADGDVRNAQYLVYKYRHKKKALWKKLEKKYGYAVLEIDEWPEQPVTGEDGEEGEEQDLDEEGAESEAAPDDDGDTETPDL